MPSTPNSIKEEEVVAVLVGPGHDFAHAVLSIVPPETADGDPLIQQTETTAADSSFLKEYYLPEVPSYLSLPADDLHVFVSIKSGAEKAESTFLNIVKPVLEALGIRDSGYNVIKTESHETIRELASTKLRAKADKGTPQTVILLSGDGGIVDLVNGLLASGPHLSTYVRPTIIILPVGTANALFHSLHRPSVSQAASTLPPSDLTAALRSLLHGTHKPLPIFRTTFSPSSRLLSNEGRTANQIPNNTLYGAIVASYGLHSSLVADSDTYEWRKHGRERFGMVAKELLSPSDGGPSHAYKARVTLRKSEAGKVVDEPLKRDEHGYVLVTLVSNLEKTFTISPATKPLDGQLRLVHFGPESGEEVMRIMTLAYQDGKHVEETGKVGYEEVEGLKIDFLEEGEEGTWRRVCIDGLIVRVEEGGWVSVEKVEHGSEAVDVVV